MSETGRRLSNYRKAVVQQRRELRGTVLKVALTRLTDLNARPVTAWPNRDKLSSSWLQCLPGPDGLGSQAFTGIPSVPAQSCLPRQGRGYSW